MQRGVRLFVGGRGSIDDVFHKIYEKEGLPPIYVCFLLILFHNKFLVWVFFGVVLSVGLGVNR